MWRCTVCQHISFEAQPPAECPVCGAPAEKFVPWDSEKVKGPKTLKNLKDAFIGESQAHARNLAFARQADEEGLPNIAHLFRAVAAAEQVQAYRYLDRMDILRDTQENLNAAFERENMAHIKAYPQLLKDANEEDEQELVRVFGQSRDVEKSHLKLYEKALQHMLAEKPAEYHICPVCGYIADGDVPEECPVCGAKGEMFQKVL
jgi:rubrerythrin